MMRYGSAQFTGSGEGALIHRVVDQAGPVDIFSIETSSRYDSRRDITLCGAWIKLGGGGDDLDVIRS